MAVRTKQLFANVTAAATTDVNPAYTAADGETVIVKRITAFERGGSAGPEVRVYLYASAGSIITLIYRRILAAWEVDDHETWVVLQPGDYLRVLETRSSGSPTYGVVICGAELEGVAD